MSTPLPPPSRAAGRWPTVGFRLAVTIALLAVVVAPSIGAASTNQPDPGPSQAGESDLVWSATFEAGDMSEWNKVTVSGDADAAPTRSPIHSGQWAAALSVRGADGEGTPPGVRLTLTEVDGYSDPENLPTDAYYGVWYLLPTPFRDDDANIFQFKQAVSYDGGQTQTRELLWSIQALWDDPHGWRLRLKTKVDQTNGAWVGDTEGSTVVAESTPRFAPLDQWFHVETRYVWSSDGQGRITSWLDGELLWDVEGLFTEIVAPYVSRPRQWTVNNYVDDSIPPDHTLYVDDATLSLGRQGTGKGTIGDPSEAGNGQATASDRTSPSQAPVGPNPSPTNDAAGAGRDRGVLIGATAIVVAACSAALLMYRRRRNAEKGTGAQGIPAVEAPEI